MTHFNDIDLRRWRDAGPADDRERIVAHLAECPECGKRYAAAVRGRSRDVVDAGDVADFVRAGLRVPRRRWPAIIAAAAAVVIAILAIPVLVHRDDPDRGVHFRGGTLRLLAPAGEVRPADLQFVWAGGIAAATYEVEIGQGDRVVIHGQAKESPFVLSPSEAARLPRGDRYWWTVSALDDSGHRVATAPRRTFSVR